MLEHIFIGELLRLLWARGVYDAEVLKAETDQGGYDLVVDCRDVTRHIQLKTTKRGGRRANVSVNTKLAKKPSGCVIWIWFDEQTLELGPFLWFGGQPKAALPNLGGRLGRHTKGDSLGKKAIRPNIRVLPKSEFTPVASLDALVDHLFGKIELMAGG